MADLKPPIVHVIIVGFHHKKGCLVEYAVPPLIEGNSSDSSELPEEWKSLPSLALPDGAHNYDEDTIYFHLTSRYKPCETLYGISCYRQINANELVNLSTEVTRNSVQKSVCVLCRLPLYGIIQSKLELITHAYFKGRDLSQHDLMEQMYETLNDVITTDLVYQESQIFFEMSCRSLLIDLQQQLLIFFKLVMLEKRVLIFSNPVRPACSAIINLLSLFPDLVQTGLTKSTRIPKIKIPRIKVDSEILAQNYANLKNPILLSQSCMECDSESSLQFSRDISDFKVRFSKSARDLESECGSFKSDKFENDDFKSISSAQNIDPMCTEGDATLSKVNIGDALEELTTVGYKVDKEINRDSVINTVDKITLNNNIPNSIITDAKYGDNFKDTCEDTRQDGNNVTLSENVMLPEKVTPSEKVVTLPENRDEDSMESLLLDTEDIIHFNSDRIFLEVLDDCSNASSINNDDSTTNAQPSTNKFAQIGTGIRDRLNNLWGSIGPTDTTEEKDKNGSSEDIFVDCVDPEILGFREKESQKDGEINVVYDELPVNDFGFPLSIFTNGVLCQPYMSLHMFDVLTNSNISGFLVGASNALFLQKMQYLDVTYEIGTGTLNIPDPELRRCLQLSTADLRFVDHMLRAVSTHQSQNEWEGSDEWIRNEFRTYLLSLLSAVLTNDDRLAEDYNSSFITAWKSTNNFAVWSQNMHPSMVDVSPEHPHRGQLSVNDVKLRLNQVLLNVDKSKRLLTAVNTTGRAVSQTGRVVGSAVTSARSVVTGWFSGIGRTK